MPTPDNIQMTRAGSWTMIRVVAAFALAHIEVPSTLEWCFILQFHRPHVVQNCVIRWLELTNKSKREFFVVAKS
jgi:hypothetical protein